MNQNNSYLRWFLLALLALIWGSSFILIKKGLVGYGYQEAATIRMMSAGAIFFIFALPAISKIPKEKYIYIFLAALLGMFIPAYLFCYAQQKVQSVVAGMLNGLTSPFAFLFSIFIYHIRYKFIQVVGLLLGFVSAMLLTFERTNESLSFNSYALFIVLATISYGLNLNMVKHKLQDIPALALSYLSVSLAGLMAFIFFFIPQWSNFTLEQHQVKPLMALITLGVFGTAVAQVLYYKLIQISSPLFTSSVTFLIPIVALFWGVVDGEKLHIEHLFCIVGILIGVALIRKS